MGGVLVCISYYDIVIHYVWKHISMYLVRYCYHQPILNQSLCKNHPTILWVNHSFKVCISVVHIISFLFAVYCCVYSSSFDIKGIICTLSDTIFASIICHIIILCGTQKVDCCMYVCYSVGVLCCSIEYPQAGCIDFRIHHIYRHNVIICPE